ncbi:MAG: hypothetical protein K2Y14_06240 [Burkholderiales bacterium]|nr:hypothetical protein [Burkholderiales bacterium]
MMRQQSSLKNIFKTLKLVFISLIGVWIVACNNGTPVAAGAILVTSSVPLIDTIYESGATMIVSNAGNRDALIGEVSADAGISNLMGCNGTTLAPAESCAISFNVSESGGNALIAVDYTGGADAQNAVYASINWFNSRGGFALVSMSAQDNPLVFVANFSGASTVTVTNIGGYTLSNIIIPTPIILGGSAVATLGTNSCAESLTLPINASCIYTVNVTDSVIDSNQQINLGFSASYAGPNGVTVYQRSSLLNYSSMAG